MALIGSIVDAKPLRALLGALFAISVGACGGRVDDADGNARASICAKQVSCHLTDHTFQPITQATCEASSVLVWPAGCVEAAEAATCADLNDASSVSYRVCHPACSTSACSADGSRFTLCSPDGATTIDCKRFCEKEGLTFTGVCGASFAGTTGPGPQCWCQ